MAGSRALSVLAVGLMAGAVGLGACSGTVRHASTTPSAASTTTSSTSGSSTTSSSESSTTTDSSTSGGSTTSTESTSSTDSSPTTPSTGPLTATAVIETALKVVPGGAVIEAGQTDDSGQQVWYVLVRAADATGTEVYLDRQTGEVVQQRPRAVPVVARATLPKLTALQGVGAALAAVPGEVVEFDLGSDRIRTVWAVLVNGDRGRFEIYVDANTGKIVKQERDS